MPATFSSATSPSKERVDCSYDSAYYAMVIESDEEHPEHGKMIKFVDESEGRIEVRNFGPSGHLRVYREVMLITISLFMGYAALVCDQV